MKIVYLWQSYGYEETENIRKFECERCYVVTQSSYKFNSLLNLSTTLHCLIRSSLFIRERIFSGKAFFMTKVFNCAKS